ncbi:hypothetical protein [Variovorax sp. V15]|uniref:hypothetical protein n=1 Tax=Variovorax sp. V15 TaxID=3065952 RepID=UPI0034E86771
MQIDAGELFDQLPQRELCDGFATPASDVLEFVGRTGDLEVDRQRLDQALVLLQAKQATPQLALDLALQARDRFAGHLLGREVGLLDLKHQA